jgi:hypothetical protein
MFSDREISDLNVKVEVKLLVLFNNNKTILKDNNNPNSIFFSKAKMKSQL